MPSRTIGLLTVWLLLHLSNGLLGQQPHGGGGHLIPVELLLVALVSHKHSQCLQAHTGQGQGSAVGWLGTRASGEDSSGRFLLDEFKTSQV